MKRKIVLILLSFALLAGGILAWSITTKYEVGLGTYLKYARTLTQAEQKYLNSKDILYGIDVEDAPFAFIDMESGQHTGILIDYFNQLSVTLENKFQPVPYENVHLAMNLKAGAIDAAVLNKTPANETVFLFTQTLYTERGKILVDGESSFETIHDAENMTIAVIAGTTAHHEANIFFGAGTTVKIVLTRDLDESFYLLGMGKVDAILGDEAKISYYLNRAIESNLFKFLDGAIYEEEVGVAVNRDQVQLFDILNKGILEMKINNQYSHIHSKWFGSFIPELEDQDFNSTAVDTFILILAIVAVFLVWNQTVSNQVTIRTRELHESRAELRGLVDSLMDGVLVLDGENRIQLCNETVLRLLDLPLDVLIGQNISQVDELKPYLTHLNERSPMKYQERYFLVSQRSLDTEENKKLVVIEDYTERYKYESLTRQEAKMIAVGELSAGLAHEIRNPLGLIKSYSYILRKKGKDQIEQHPLNVIDESVDRINSLIENLLGFSRLSTERNVRVNVEALVLSLVDLERKRLEKSQIQVKTQFRLEAGPMMCINGDVLKLVLVNLINNSIDAFDEVTREEKRIDIQVWTAENKLYVDFGDNGIGIPKENLETIFNPFFTTKETGTGLGLYILNSELRGIEGSITAESGEGQGAVFHVMLPIESEEEHEQ